MSKLPLTDLPLSSWNVSGSWNYTETAVSRLFLLTKVLWNCCKLQNLQQLFLNMSLTFPLLLLFEQCWKKCIFSTSRLSLVLLCIRRCLFVFVTVNTGSTSDDKIWVGLGCPQVRAPPDSLHFPPPPSPPSPPLPKFTKNLTKFLILPPSSQVSFEGCQGEQSLTKNILFSLRCSFTGTDKIFLVLHEKKEIGNFSPLTWRGTLFHLGIFASCHSCARKETISSLSSLKVAAQ